MTSFTIEVKADAVQAVLKQLASRAGGLQLVFSNIGAGIVERAQRRFETSTGPDGVKWKENSAATLAMLADRIAGSKSKRKKDGSLNAAGQRDYANKKPLIGESKHLKNSIEAKASKTTLIVQSMMAYSAIHQFGGKGMWMGGPLPLGYDVVSRLLVVNEVEAATVRRIFDDLVQERSATMMVRQLALDGKTTKTGRKFCKQAIYKILHNRMYLGEINHKGKNYPGAHLPIITQQQWDDAHAVLDSDRRERWRDTKAKDAPASLLRGLIFAPDGERLMPTYTIKKGKTYRYYVPNRVGHFGAGASKICTIPAEPIEALVVAQVVDALSSPMVVQGVWDQARTLAPELTEPQVVLPMRRLASMWPNLFAAEQQRLVRLLIEKVVLSDSGLEIVWCDAGWQTLSAELSPGTIGAELAEMEAA